MTGPPPSTPGTPPTPCASPIDLDRLVRETFLAGAEYHEEIGSTNDRAAEWAAVPAARLPILIVAARQTAGRGRGANRWWTGSGSLAMSLLLEPLRRGGPSAGASGRGRSPLAALAAGLAVAEAVAPRLPGRRVGIRWPNDVYVGRGKLAGVLVEVLSTGRTVVGIGLNTNNTAGEAPAELRDRVATMRDLAGRPFDHADLLADLLGQMERNFALLAADPGRLGRRADDLCLQRGEALAVRSGSRLLRGRCLGIAPDGALLIETPGGNQAIYSGAVEGVE
jgi:BirA family transcriptional regulator, biotin operon repressor / biotin---[acetyl-CoA-carboxylase] ligase